MSDLTAAEEQWIHDADIARQEAEAEDLDRRMRAKETREAIAEDRKWSNR